MAFDTLGLNPGLLTALTRLGFEAPTPIQIAALPAAMKGRDVLANAPTGSGKTLAFALPLLHSLLAAPRAQPGRTRGLVLVPTRELAQQVGETFKSLTQALPTLIKVTVVYGGVSINPQMLRLRSGTDVIVATPGRLIDLLDQRALQLGDVQTLVLDEADRLLDLGFAEELDRILALLPRKRHNLFFSATFPKTVQALAQSLLVEPLHVTVAPNPSELPLITQRAIQVDAPRRTQLLRHLIQDQKWPRVLVFVASKHATEIVADKLRKADIQAEPLHGALSQGKRTQVLADFKASRIQVMVATDLAARGIDIAQLPAVVNFDLPRSAVDYVHRIGRTARAGESGVAVSFVDDATLAHFRLIEKRNQVSLTVETVTGFEPARAKEPAATASRPAKNAPGTGGIKGKRPSKKDKLRALEGPKP